jgi:hypothetical protein
MKLVFLIFIFVILGSIEIEFTVESVDNNDSATEALANKTTKLKEDMASGGINMTVGDLELTVPPQNITEVDVSKTISATHPMNFKLTGSLSDHIIDDLNSSLVDEIAIWGGLQMFKEQIAIIDLKDGL